MKSFSSANKVITWVLFALLLAIPFQIGLSRYQIPDFVKNRDTVIHKTIVSYGKTRDDHQSRTIEYHLAPYLWNRYELLTSIEFDHGQTLKTQFLISFFPSNLFSIQYISQLVEAEEVQYFDPPEQHVLFDGGDENFQVLVERDHLYCYIQLSNQAVQCVDVN